MRQRLSHPSKSQNGMAEQLTQSTSFYRQVKNPNPKFIPEEGKKTLPFCEKIRAKAAGFTRRMEFQMLVAMSIARGERKRRPPELRMRALEASLQALCHYFNPLANRVGASAALSGKTGSARRGDCRAPAPKNLSVPPGHLCVNVFANTRSHAVNTA